MTYSTKSIANTILGLAEEKSISITPMKMQKLLYYAQAWYYHLKGQVLFDDSFYKWDYGPVIPELYQDLRCYGAEKITSNISDYPIVKNNDVQSFLNRILTVYGEYSAYELSFMTHREGSAWLKANYNSIIDLENMAKEVG